MNDRPSILEVIPEPAHGQPCHCFCGARHPLGVCAGYLEEPGFRVHFNSIFNTSGVVICRPCAEAYPEGIVPPSIPTEKESFPS